MPAPRKKLYEYTALSAGVVASELRKRATEFVKRLSIEDRRLLWLALNPRYRLSPSVTNLLERTTTCLIDAVTLVQVRKRSPPKACRNGHPYEGDNRLVDQKTGQVRCRECHRVKNRRWKRRQIEARREKAANGS